MSHYQLVKNGYHVEIFRDLDEAKTFAAENLSLDASVYIVDYAVRTGTTVIPVLSSKHRYDEELKDWVSGPAVR